MPATLADIQAKYGKDVFPENKDEMYEPFVENENGIGYLGVILRNVKTDLILCNLCGGWKESIGTHLYDSFIYRDSLHIGIKNTLEYREKYGLFKKDPLCSKRLSSLLSINAINNNKFMKVSKAGNIKRFQNKDKQQEKSLEAHRKMSYKNKYGKCDEQIRVRIERIKKIVKREPRDADLRKYDGGLNHYLDERFGSANRGLIRYGYSPPSRKDEFKWKVPLMLSLLREFVVCHKRIPSSRELNNKDGYPTRGTYRERFGSWNRVKMMAGLDQLLLEVKNE